MWKKQFNEYETVSDLHAQLSLDSIVFQGLMKSRLYIIFISNAEKGMFKALIDFAISLHIMNFFTEGEYRGEQRK